MTFDCKGCQITLCASAKGKNSCGSYLLLDQKNGWDRYKQVFGVSQYPSSATLHTAPTTPFKSMSYNFLGNSRESHFVGKGTKTHGRTDTFY